MNSNIELTHIGLDTQHDEENVGIEETAIDSVNNDGDKAYNLVDFSFFSNMDANTIIMNCERFGRALCLSAAALIIVGGVAALFSTAFTTCNEVSLRNKTDDAIVVYYSWPVKTEAPAVILPHTIHKIKFNGINSYVDLHTNAGTMHFNTHGGGVLKEGADNRQITNGHPLIVFWTCNKRYTSANTNADAATTHLRGSDVDWKSNDDAPKNHPEYTDLKKTTNSPLLANSFLKPSKDLNTQVENTLTPTTLAF